MPIKICARVNKVSGVAHGNTYLGYEMHLHSQHGIVRSASMIVAHNELKLFQCIRLRRQCYASIGEVVATVHGKAISKILDRKIDDRT